MTLTSTPLKTTVRWNIQDLAGFPDNGNCYEIIDGELFVTRAPHARHQDIAGQIYAELRNWSRQTKLGLPYFGPGVIFSPEDAVIPDVVWASQQCINTALDEAGHFTRAPELMVEVLSLAPKDQDRDRRTKLKLYTAYGVREYWIADRQTQTLEVYRWQNNQLRRWATLKGSDRLTSPLLPDFSCEIGIFFEQ
ncbi:MAG: Uma2 family endonuclease [Spirulina sp. SIO3F2]|nr:Uma2 family endonuclease [Spirulina sp. SIO3F2]